MFQNFSQCTRFVTEEIIIWSVSHSTLNECDNKDFAQSFLKCALSVFQFANLIFDWDCVLHFSFLDQVFAM